MIYLSPEEELPKLTTRQLSQSPVIAKGKRIRDLPRLIENYGRTPRRWLKKSSPAISISNRRAEVHWYEHPDIGRVEEKIKWLEP